MEIKKTMTINPTKYQDTKPWTITWKATGRYPIVADRIFATLSDARAYVNSTATSASAIPGLILSVVDDVNTPSNNGVYFVKSIANSDATAEFPVASTGTLVKIGSTDTQVFDKYTDAVDASENLAVGQLIKVLQEEEKDETIYSPGFYIVNIPGSILPLTGNVVTGNVESNTPIHIALSVFDNKETGSLQEIISDVSKFKYPTTDICIDGYYPTRKNILAETVEYYYYIPFVEEDDLEKIYRVCLVINNDPGNHWAFTKTSMVLTESELDTLFDLTE